MHLQADCSLQDKHSLGFDVRTRYWGVYSSVSALRSILQEANSFGLNILPIGKGCNLFFTHDFDGLLLHSNIESFDLIDEDDDSVLIEVGAGWQWDALVEHCVAQGWGGLENLSGIPSSVGASPVQNIGAYGVEAKDFITSVNLLDRQTLEERRVDASDCDFAYRDSRFKHEWKDRYIVISVRFRLSKRPHYDLSYDHLKSRVEALGWSDSHLENLRTIRRAVLSIRNEKLPPTEELGSVGSFFMNPVVDRALAQECLANYPAMPCYELTDGRCKLSAAWLIDACGWKGKRLGNVGVYPKQALVLVHYGAGHPDELVRLYHHIIDDVFQRFGIRLQPEAVIL